MLDPDFTERKAGVSSGCFAMVPYFGLAAALQMTSW
jgi:hypothetical protein